MIDPAPPHDVPFYHVCFVVPDLEAAMADLAAAVGCRWLEPSDGRYGDSALLATFSLGGPPYIELVTAGPDSPWDASTGARFDHLGYWTNSLPTTSNRLLQNGFPEEFTGCPFGRPFTGHHIASIGARIELFDTAAQPYFIDTVGHTQGPMPALDER
ncbi:VOC family protein [Nocardia sp. NPDC051756]|uniref:VOC family protein n=1 Tax=Nocardia sp. NPDC051756 TaxID=3154751 RepID=UPI0034411EEB